MDFFAFTGSSQVRENMRKWIKNSMYGASYDVPSATDNFLLFNMKYPTYIRETAFCNVT